MSSPSATLAPPPVLPAAQSDFPTWLPAMLVKELRQGLRTKGFVGAFIIFQLIMVLLMLSTVLGSAFANSGARAAMAATINGFFWTLLGVQLLFVTPGRALGSLQVELESRSLDLLMLTRLTAWRIVLGKWGSLMAQAFLLFLAMLPYGIVRYFVGSVDLVQDAYLSAALLGGCGVMTAVGLAGSGMPKAARILMPILIVVGLQVVTPLIRVATGRGFSGSSPFAMTLGSNAWLLWLNGALVMGIFLVIAVRRIAPPAENHMLLPRGLALLTLLPIPFLSLFSKLNDARGQLAFAGLVIAIVSAVELASMRWPMKSHWRPFARRGPPARWLGRFALPGWPSGFAFIVIAGLLLAFAGWLPGLAGSTDKSRISWLVVLGVVGLVFPAVALSFFSRAGRAPAALYVLVLAITCLLAAMAAAIGGITNDQRDFLEVTSVFPGAGFCITLFSPRSVSSSAMMVQGAVAITVLGVAWVQSRVYWKHLAKIDAEVRAEKA